MKMIPNVRGRWHRLWSMRFILISTGLGAGMTTFAMMPAEWQAAIPTAIVKGCAVALFLSSIMAGVSRVISQPKLKEDTTSDEPPCEDKHEGGE